MERGGGGDGQQGVATHWKQLQGVGRKGLKPTIYL